MISNKYNQHYLLIAVFALMFGLLLTGCGTEEPAGRPAEATTPLNIQLDWIHTSEYAGFYAAEEEGYFAGENLAVQLTSGGFDADGNFINSVDRVMSGQADFGVTDSNGLLVARANGTPVVGIATIYQRNPVAFMSLAQKNITKPRDLVGTKLAIDLQSATGISYLALLASQGIDPASINQVPRTDYTNTPLINGEVDVLDAFITNQPVQLELAGYDVNVILASDYGIDMYPNVIFTSESMIANNPELVERFLRATIRGIQRSIDNPEQVTTLVTARNDEADPEIELVSMNRSLPLIKPAGSRPGMMQAKAWQTSHQILLDQGILNEPLDLSSVYDLSFLEKVYSQATNY